MRGTAGDVDGLAEVPSFGFIQTGFLYHSAADDLKYYSADELALVIRAHAFLVDGGNELTADEMKSGSGDDVLPIYYSPHFLELLSSW
jgi:hypothetical protein